MIAAVFPGQGSQHVGMCYDFYTQFEVVRRLFQEIEDTIHLNLRQVMFDGCESDLRATHYAQPALLTTSVGIMRVLAQEFGITIHHWRMMAGHSLGEYTALHMAGVLSLDQTLKIIQARGQAMATIENGGMVAVIGLLPEMLNKMVHDLNHEGIDCVLANDNSPQQAVLSAAVVHLPILVERSRALGAIKSLILNVSGPFHSPMMQPAQEIFTPLLDVVPFQSPRCPIITNVSGKEQNNPMVIKDHARQQMTHSVLWRHTQLTMSASHVTHMVEIGSGKVLCGLAKKTIPGMQTLALNSTESLKNWDSFDGASRHADRVDTVQLSAVSAM